MKAKLFGSIIGLIVGDALGVPVEFQTRKEVRHYPVLGMRGYGTYNQPSGTWSDDSSLTLCLVDSLCDGLDYYDIMNNFKRWYTHAEYTPYCEVFDIGDITKRAISKFIDGEKPLLCGCIGKYDNGNGSLMRIIPIAIYLYDKYGNTQIQEEEMNIIHNISALTHGNNISLMCCGIYIQIAKELIEEEDKYKAIYTGLNKAMNYYKNNEAFKSEIELFERLMDLEVFINSHEKDINSGGYVLYSLEAAIWCLANSNSYSEAVLKAVNLGEDTDTIGAITGGLAGIYYGYENIPKEWVNSLAKINFIKKLCTEFENSFIKEEYNNKYVL